jgi:hypothetical protein
MSNATEAVCALQQVISKLPELVRATIRHQILNLGSSNPDVYIPELESGQLRSDTPFLNRSI